MDNNIFLDLWNEIDKEISFNQDWLNKAGYLDDIVSVDFKLGIGERCKFTISDGRKAILVETQVGNVVFFQRYVGNVKLIVYNAPERVKDTYLSNVAKSTVRHKLLYNLVGKDTNVGFTFQKLINVITNDIFKGKSV